MDKKEFEKLLKLLIEMNEHLDNIESRLDQIDNKIERIKGETKKKRSSMFDL